jgi:hypothetical protein
MAWRQKSSQASEGRLERWAFLDVLPDDGDRMALGQRMTERDMLMELLAIKLYEHDTEVDGPGWTIIPEDKRAAYRERVVRARTVYRLYPSPSLAVSTPPGS